MGCPKLVGPRAKGFDSQNARTRGTAPRPKQITCPPARGATRWISPDLGQPVRPCSRSDGGGLPWLAGPRAESLTCSRPVADYLQQHLCLGFGLRHGWVLALPAPWPLPRSCFSCWAMAGVGHWPEIAPPAFKTLAPRTRLALCAMRTAIAVSWLRETVVLLDALRVNVPSMPPASASLEHTHFLPVLRLAWSELV